MAMFEALFVGASFFEAAVWFVGGSLLGGIGLAFFVDSLVFRRRAVKKRARILGVIGKKQAKGGQTNYWPVYEHMSDDGELIQTRSSASGSLAGNLPGAFRDVLVDPDDPYDVRSLTPVGMIVGVIYSPADLERAIIDRGIWNWAIPGGSGLFGALILAVSLRGLVGAHRRRAAGVDPRGEEAP